MSEVLDFSRYSPPTAVVAEKPLSPGGSTGASRQHFRPDKIYGQSWSSCSRPRLLTVKGSGRIFWVPCGKGCCRSCQSFKAAALAHEYAEAFMALIKVSGDALGLYWVEVSDHEKAKRVTSVATRAGHHSLPVRREDGTAVVFTTHPRKDADDLLYATCGDEYEIGNWILMALLNQAVGDKEYGGKISRLRGTKTLEAARKAVKYARIRTHQTFNQLDHAAILAAVHEDEGESTDSDFERAEKQQRDPIFNVNRELLTAIEDHDRATRYYRPNPEGKQVPAEYTVPTSPEDPFYQPHENAFASMTEARNPADRREVRRQGDNWNQHLDSAAPLPREIPAPTAPAITCLWSRACPGEEDPRWERQKMTTPT